MKLICPNCQRELTVPDQYAGQLMKCPLCQGNFTAPTLPDAFAASPPPPAPAPGPTYGLALEPPGPKPPPPRAKPEPEPVSADEVVDRPPPPSGEYRRRATLWVSPRVVPWVAPVAALTLFVLLFFPWVDVYDRYEDGVASRNAWELAFGQGRTALMILYVLLFLPTLLLAVAVCVLGWQPDLVKLPPALAPVRPWRSALLAGVAFLAFIFLLFQFLAGFGGLAEGGAAFLTRRTVWMWLALLCHLALIAGALLDFWLTLREGRERPLPRVVLEW